MKLTAIIAKYKVGLTYKAADIEEINLGKDNEYPEIRTIPDNSDMGIERNKFIDELAQKISGINYNNRQYAIDNKLPSYFKLILTKI